MSHNMVKKQVHLLHLIVMFLCSLLGVASAQLNWMVHNFAPPGQAYRSVIFTGAQYMIVGDNGTILTSPDTKHWTSQFPGTTARRNIRCVSWNGNKYLAVGDHCYSYTSNDGYTWVARGSSSDYERTQLNSIAWNSKLFVAVGEQSGMGSPGGVIRTSPDGEVWSGHLNSNSYDGLFSVAWNGKEFMAVGGKTNTFDRRAIFTSSNGTTWKRTVFTDLKYYSCIIYDSTQFVYSSQDTVFPFNTIVKKSAVINALTYNGRSYIAVGNSGMISMSTDGKVWTEQRSGLTTTLYSLTWDGSRFIAVGDSSKVITSVDGTKWDSVQTRMSFGPVVWDGNRYLSYNGKSLYTSKDGISWDIMQSNITGIVSSMCTANQSIVAVGSNGLIQTSNDGVVWRPESTGTAEPLNSVAYGNGVFVAVGDTSIFASSNGSNWERQSVVKGLGKRFITVTYGLGRFVAAGENGLVATSSDGRNWKYNTIEPWYRISKMTSGNGQFLAIADSASVVSKVFMSTNGESWRMTFKHNSQFNSVIFGDSTFVVPYDNFHIATSKNGSDWEFEELKNFVKINDGTFNNDRFFLFGYTGTIVTSSHGGITRTSPSAVSSMSRQYSITTMSEKIVLNLSNNLTGAGHLVLKMHTLSGKLIRQQESRQVSGKIMLSTDGCAKGLYIISINCGGKHYRTSVITGR